MHMIHFTIYIFMLGLFLHPDHDLASQCPVTTGDIPIRTIVIVMFTYVFQRDVQPTAHTGDEFSPKLGPIRTAYVPSNRHYKSYIIHNTQRYTSLTFHLCAFQQYKNFSNACVYQTDAHSPYTPRIDWDTELIYSDILPLDDTTYRVKISTCLVRNTNPVCTYR